MSQAPVPPASDPHASPEERLWHACLRQVVDLAAGRSTRGFADAALRREQAEARRWLFAPDNPHRREVCAVLGVSESFLIEVARRAGVAPGDEVSPGGGKGQRPGAQPRAGGRPA